MQAAQAAEGAGGRRQQQQARSSRCYAGAGAGRRQAGGAQHRQRAQAARREAAGRRRSGGRRVVIIMNRPSGTILNLNPRTQCRIIRPLFHRRRVPIISICENPPTRSRGRCIWCRNRLRGRLLPTRPGSQSLHAERPRRWMGEAGRRQCSIRLCIRDAVPEDGPANRPQFARRRRTGS